MRKRSFVAALSAVCCLLGATQYAHSANFFNWSVESDATSRGSVQVWNSGTSRSSATSHSGNYSMKLAVIGNDGNNQQMGVDLDQMPYSRALVGSAAVYYRWWMRIDQGFSWGSGTAKTKSSRILSGTQGYTGYLMSYGFLIGECDGGGCKLANGGSNSSDTQLYIPFDFNKVADGVWHEYIVKIKPNTSASCTPPTNCDAQFQAWVDGVSVGEYNNFKLHNNSSDQMTEAWSGWMEKPYFQIGGTSSDGGTIYLDDFSTDDTFNSIFSPNTTVALAAPINLKAK